MRTNDVFVMDFESLFFFFLHWSPFTLWRREFRYCWSWMPRFLVQALFPSKFFFQSWSFFCGIFHHSLLIHNFLSNISIPTLGLQSLTFFPLLSLSACHILTFEPSISIVYIYIAVVNILSVVVCNCRVKLCFYAQTCHCWMILLSPCPLGVPVPKMSKVPSNFFLAFLTLC